MNRSKILAIAAFGLLLTATLSIALSAPAAEAASAVRSQENAQRVESSAPGFLGVVTESLTDSLRRHFGAPTGVGVLVSDLSEAGAAEKAGIAVGDVIVEVDGKAIEDASDLRRVIRRAGAGSQVEVAVIRDGQRRMLSANLNEASSSRTRVRSHSQWRDHKGSDSSDLDEARWEEFGERMGEFGERMGEAGERIGEHWAQWGEEFGERMAEWGERFAERWEGKLEGHEHARLSEEERARIGEEVEQALSGVDWDRIGADVEKALGAVDWEHLNEEISQSIESAMKALDNIEIEWEPAEPKN